MEGKFHSTRIHQYGILHTVGSYRRECRLLLLSGLFIPLKPENSAEPAGYFRATVSLLKNFVQAERAQTVQLISHFLSFLFLIWTWKDQRLPFTALCTKSSFLVLCTKVMFIIYQRQGFVSSHELPREQRFKIEKIFHNAKKSLVNLSPIHIFVHFDNQQRGRKFSNECSCWESDEARGAEEPSQPQWGTWLQFLKDVAVTIFKSKCISGHLIDWYINSVIKPEIQSTVQRLPVERPLVKEDLLRRRTSFK